MLYNYPSILLFTLALLLLVITVAVVLICLLVVGSACLFTSSCRALRWLRVKMPEPDFSAMPDAPNPLLFAVLVVVLLEMFSMSPRDDPPCLIEVWAEVCVVVWEEVCKAVSSSNLS